MEPQEVLKLNPLKLLGEIEDRARMAREALQDEHEGNFTHHVLQIEGLAGQLAQLTREW